MKPKMFAQYSIINEKATFFLKVAFISYTVFIILLGSEVIVKNVFIRNSQII